jgi:phage-related protein
MDDQLVPRSIGSKIKHAFQKVGSEIKHGFQKVGSEIKHVAQKVGTGIKTAVKKVGNFIKTTGAKIVKFGLKVVQSVGEVIGKVASFIPAIGKPIDQAINGVSKVAGVISDHIHAKLSAKLQKGMNVMNKADKIVDYIPRRRDFSEEQAFQQRDISEANYFEERDDIALEN